MTRLDKTQVYRWFDIMKANNELVEIRLIGSNKTGSGYFSDADTLINAVEPYTDSFNVYFTINPINSACYSREQKDKIVLRPKNTTTDTEVTCRNYVLIDLDPKRPSGVCSTKEEATKAYEKGLQVKKFLMDNGFYEPIMVFSSSGIHIYIRCALQNTEENTKLVKRFLQALGMLFTDEYVDCDLSVFNAARISRLVGSYSCKGAANDKERPQRKCRFISIPNEIKVNEKEYFEKIAKLFPEEEVKPSAYNGYSSEKFNLESFIAKHNIEITKVQKVAGGTKYLLKECPWNPNHKSPDSMIFQRDNGALSFFCYHNSCSHYTWSDFRLLFEPDAYDKKEYNEFRHKQRYFGYREKEPFIPQKEDEAKGKKWLSMSDIQYVDMSTMVTIPTGFTELDKKIMGLLLGDVTVLSGLSGAGKTSWLDCVLLNVIQRGYKCAVWSGELQDFRFQSWIDQIAAGKNHVAKKAGYDNFYYAPRNICDKVNEWLKGKLYLYNNEYGNHFNQLFDDLKNCIEENGTQLIVLDNLMALNISHYDGDKYTQQTNFINELKDFAKKKNVHIILVCHPRKESNNTLLRKESISGTADLTNMADQVIILHRVGNDFEKRASEFWGKERVQELMQYSCVIEVCKNRSFGVVDYVVGMFYEVESRRLKNSIAEHIVYGWEDNESIQQVSMPIIERAEDAFDENFSDSCPF